MRHLPVENYSFHNRNNVNGLTQSLLAQSKVGCHRGALTWWCALPEVPVPVFCRVIRCPRLRRSPMAPGLGYGHVIVSERPRLASQPHGIRVKVPNAASVCTSLCRRAHCLKFFTGIWNRGCKNRITPPHATISACTLTNTCQHLNLLFWGLSAMKSHLEVGLRIP